MPRRLEPAAGGGPIKSACPQCSCGLVWLLGLAVQRVAAGRSSCCDSWQQPALWRSCCSLAQASSAALGGQRHPGLCSLSSSPSSLTQTPTCILKGKLFAKMLKAKKCSMFIALLPLTNSCSLDIAMHWTSQQTIVLLLCPPEKWDWNSEKEVLNVGESYRYLGQSSHTTLTDSYRRNQPTNSSKYSTIRSLL